MTKQNDIPEVDPNDKQHDDEAMDGSADLHEHGLFISQDKIRESAPWRLNEYRDHGALTDDQIISIAEQFRIDPSEMCDLSKAVGHALDPHATIHVIGIKRSLAVERAQQSIRKTCTDTGAALDLLSVSAKRIKHLNTEHAGNHEGAREFEKLRHRLSEIIQSLSEVELGMNYLLTDPDIALDLKPVDKRLVVDRRRTGVLTAIFHTWWRSGRSLTITTDPITSERRGPLVDFVNSVVVCVTEPPSTLSGETIRKEVKTQKDAIPALDSVMNELLKGIQDT